jgi:two-component system KDP operon response regulator KdpE
VRKILVVDDERQITRMLRAALQSSGYEVLVANNGSEALKRFEIERPDVIITDLSMPEMNGIELTQAVRTTSDTPIIVLSVRDTDVMKVAALDEGADDYLTKPFSIQELLHGSGPNSGDCRAGHPFLYESMWEISSSIRMLIP